MYILNNQYNDWPKRNERKFIDAMVPIKEAYFD